MKPRVACINAPLPTRPTLPPTTSSPAANLSPNWALLFHNVCYRTCHPSGIFCARLVMGRFHDPVMTSRAAPIVLFARRRLTPSVETTKQPCTWERKKATVIGISLLHVSVLLKAFPSTLQELRCAFRQSYDIAVPLGFWHLDKAGDGKHSICGRLSPHWGIHFLFHYYSSWCVCK